MGKYNNYEDIHVDLWLKRNSIKEKEDYLNKVMHQHGINCNFTHNRYGEYDIWFTYMRKNYRIEINEQELCYNLLEENMAGIKMKNKYHLVEKFYGDDILYKIIKYVQKRGNVNVGVIE